MIRLRRREPQADGITIRTSQRGTFSTASTHCGLPGRSLAWANAWLRRQIKGEGQLGGFSPSYAAPFATSLFALNENLPAIGWSNIFSRVRTDDGHRACGSSLGIGLRRFPICGVQLCAAIRDVIYD